MDSKVREVRMKTWGFVQSNTTWVKGERYAMTVLLIALPNAEGTWRGGAVHYSSR